jgi:indoleamine 2,3-dioxygenase
MSPMIEDHPGPHFDSITSTFPHIFSNPSTLPTSLDPFTITTSTGFLPLRPPQINLPTVFAPLTNLLEDLPIVKADGTPGLLATYQLGAAIDGYGVLPDLTADIDKLVAEDGKPDMAAVTAAFRDYAFLASAYLLEPCWKRWNEGEEGYGIGREVLPKEIAGPLVKTAAL